MLAPEQAGGFSGTTVVAVDMAGGIAVGDSWVGLIAGAQPVKTNHAAN
ncbi:MAG TPA: hypothetical protein VMN99_12390 [Anaerolineales bacterium]|nr:hypothetical protein [Anaerolineales bacterium]